MKGIKLIIALICVVAYTARSETKLIGYKCAGVGREGVYDLKQLSKLGEYNTIEHLYSSDKKFYEADTWKFNIHDSLNHISLR